MSVNLLRRAAETMRADYTGGGDHDVFIGAVADWLDHAASGPGPDSPSVAVARAYLGGSTFCAEGCL